MDGQNNTPDLRDRFYCCAGSKYGVGAKGGQDSVILDPLPNSCTPT